MSYVTEPMSIARLRQIVNMSTAGLTPAQIARQLFDAGIPVPRAGGHPANWPDRGVVGGPKPSVEDGGDGLVVVLTPQTFPESRDGYCLDTEPGNPSRWTAAAVSQVLAAPEASPTGDYAAARAKLGSDVKTTLTVA